MRFRRRGILLLEAAAAGALLAVVLAILLRILATTAIERRDAEKRAVALEETAGAIERATLIPFDEITPQRLAALRLSPAVERLLPEAKLAWTLEPTTSGPPAKHLRAELSWQSPLGNQRAAVRLNHWMFSPAGRPGGGSP